MMSFIASVTRASSRDKTPSSSNKSGVVLKEEVVVGIPGCSWSSAVVLASFIGMMIKTMMEYVACLLQGGGVVRLPLRGVIYEDRSTVSLLLFVATEAADKRHVWQSRSFAVHEDHSNWTRDLMTEFEYRIHPFMLLYSA